MRTLALLTLLALPAFAEGRFERFCSRADTGRSDRGFLCGSTFFEAFTSSGAGTSGVCSTTAPTGAKGEVLTFTRASSATCQKTATGGLATTGIADGDWVQLTNNQPRVEYRTAGVLGLRDEKAGTNGVLRSEEIDNAAWTDIATGAAVPTLNGACGTSPLAAPGSMPEDYSFPATAAGQDSVRAATSYAACVGVVCSSSIAVKGPSGSGTFDLCVYGGAAGLCQPCAWNSTSWTRCSYPNHNSAGLASLVIGNSTKWNGGTARSAARVCITAAQMETGDHVTSYIPTGGAAATRAGESAYMTLAAAPNATGLYSLAATVSVTRASTTTFCPVIQSTGAGGDFRALYGNGANFVSETSSGTAVTASRASVGAFTDKRIAGYNDGTNQYGIYDGATFGPVAGTRTAPSATRVYLGNSFAAGYEIDGIVSNVCLDGDPTRCR